MRTLFLIPIPVLVVLSSLTAQDVIKPDNLRLDNDKVIITYQVRPTDECLSVKSVMVSVISSNQKIVAKTITGDLKEAKTGSHQIVWDYKADRFYVDGQVDVSIIVESCKKAPKVDSEQAKVKKPSETITKIVDPNRVPHPVGLKIGVAGISVLAGAGAFVVWNDYNSKLTALTNLDAKFNGLTAIPEPQYSEWSKAYSEAQSARKSGVFTALVGVAALSAAYEAYLLFTKRKINRRLSLAPSGQSVGLAFTLKL